MGLVSALAQCALDFLIDERCHACAAEFGDAPAGALPPLAAPVDVIALGSFRLKSRLLCMACASRVRRWTHPVTLAPRAGERGYRDALAVHAAFVTDDRLLTVIHLLKFGRCERVAPWLARAMMPGLPSVSTGSGAGDRIVAPVPMDRSARRRRGFNQAESIARVLAAQWQLPMVPRALVKMRHTRPQSALGRNERLVNLEGAFSADPIVRGMHVILVDDLVTTGATVRACAGALRRAGAREVSVICAGYRDEAPPSRKAVSPILTTTSGGNNINGA